MSVKHLLIGSPEAYSGKSAIILGVAHQLQRIGLSIAYGKPVGTCVGDSHDDMDADVQFIAKTLKLGDRQLLPTLISLNEKTIARRIQGDDQADYSAQLTAYQELQGCDLAIIEGSGTLDEGRLFGLSVLQLATQLEAKVLLVARFHSELVVETLLAARDQLGEQLLGVLINDVPHDQIEAVNTYVRSFLEKSGIAILGILPRSDLLRSVSVGELVHQLDAQVLCRGDRLDLLVEELKIGAMNVSSALKYFRKARNMAVVTGGDRTDIQLAALETSTHCLILTGQIAPMPTIVSKAEELEIPILSVDLDTLTTVEIIDRTFGQVRVHEMEKVQYLQHLIHDQLDVQRLLDELGLKP